MASAPPVRVLVVDDAAADRVLLREQLRVHGIDEVAEADCGRCAVTVLDEEGPVDLVLTDLAMPGMDGVELVRELSRRPDRPEVVLMTGLDQVVLSSAASTATAYGLGVVGTLAKPVDDGALDTLLDLLRTGAPTAESVDGEAAPFIPSPAWAGRALERGWVRVAFQPQVDHATLRVVGAEALLRHDSTRGAAAPRAIVQAAAVGGLTDRLTDHVLQRAAEAVTGWSAVLTAPAAVSVNVEVSSLQDVSSVDRWASIVSSAGASPEQVVLEITEHEALPRTGQVLDVLSRLRIAGFGLSLDDFGGGYTSMASIGMLPLTELKLDRGLVHGVHRDWRKAAMVQSLVDLGQRLDLRVIAEGVEHPRDLEALAEAGCAIVQGWIFGAAMSVEALADYVVTAPEPSDHGAGEQAGQKGGGEIGSPDSAFATSEAGGTNRSP